jgi:zinc transport system substrate-binding protein
VFFYQKEFDSRQAEVVNEQIGAEMVIINPLNYRWNHEMLIIADAIASK